MFSHSHSLQRNSPFAHSLCIVHGTFIGVEFADRINELNFMVHNVKHIQPSRAENVKLCAGLLILSQFGCSCCRCLRRPFILLQNCKSKLHLLVKRQNIDCVYTNLIRFHQSFRVCYSFRWLVGLLCGFFRNSRFILRWFVLCVHRDFRIVHDFLVVSFWKCQHLRESIFICSSALCSICCCHFGRGETVSAFSFILCITNFIHFVCILDTCRNEGMQLIRWNLNRNGIEPFVCS